MIGKAWSGVATMMLLTALLSPSPGRAAGAYLGTSAVMSKVDADYSGGGLSSDTDSHLGIHAGYRFGERLAFEASYARLAKTGGSLCNAGACIPETGTFDFEADRVEMVVLAYVPLGPNAQLFAKVGAGRVETQARITPWGANPSYFDSADTVGVFGAGLAWRVARRTALRLQFDRHESGATDGTALWVGVTFSLGS
jgi:hypothetical protein